MADYLAIITIGGGSSWGRSQDKETAIGTAIKSLRDWRHLFNVSNIEVPVNVIDVSGYSACCWGNYPDGWLRGTNEASGKEYEPINRPIEVVTRTTPNWRKPK